MGYSLKSSFFAIEHQGASLVYACLVFFLSFSFISARGAEDDSKPAPDFIQAQVHVFEVSVANRSQSGKLYLMESVGAQEIPVGKIMLLKNQTERVMAVRVIRTFPDRLRFVAKRAKKYRKSFLLDEGEHLYAYIKIGESKVPARTKLENKELRQFEDEIHLNLELPPEDRPAPVQSTLPPPIQPKLPDSLDPVLDSYDPELDSAERPPGAGPQAPAPVAPEPKKPLEPLPRTDEYDPELDAGSSHPSSANWGDLDEELEVIEQSSYGEPERNWITAQIGLIRNRNFEDKSEMYAGGGFRYGLSSLPPLLFKGARVQDSIGLELGALFYRVNGIVSDTDSYSLVGITFTGRYNIFVGETFTPFLYAGVLKNMILTANDQTDEGTETLNTLYSAFGTGAFFTVGPKWKLRVDLGYDMIALGITLRF